MGLDRTAAWVIWSFEHDGWWAPGEWGYVESLAEAGWYTEARAKQIEARANIIHRNEIAVALVEAERQGVPVVNEEGQ